MEDIVYSKEKIQERIEKTEQVVKEEDKTICNILIKCFLLKS